MGIDRSIFDNISQNLICSVCLDVLEDPATALCGHTCCYSCWYMIAKVSRRSPKEVSCPMCRDTFGVGNVNSYSSFVWMTEGRKLIKSRIIKEIINESLTNCHWAGCKIKIKYSEREQHIHRCLTVPELRTRIVPAPREAHGVDDNQSDTETSSHSLDSYREMHWCTTCGRGYSSQAMLNLHVLDFHEPFYPNM